MTEVLGGKELLPDSTIRLRGVEKIDDRWVIKAEGGKAAACPACGVLSSAQRSNYQRHLKDLPLQGRAVRIQLAVGRWRDEGALPLHRRRRNSEPAPRWAMVGQRGH